ncbi:hypothetical protein H2201_005479 [Coniosporium apollinis]|uniref:Major facilitator superfamily (MFS) profile domain-containing protein n=1 Tax=Coniosporium apollinis TaxID=61459 RepID=A0ABQ9NQH4_9PEZI|nr:hypothetical protein H2201_005479 [Coniosporium apollinis]
MEKRDGADAEAGRTTPIPYWKIVADQKVVTPEIVNWHYKGSGTEDDPYLVEWIDNDPRNPMLFSTGTKLLIALTVAFETLCVSFGSSTFSGGIGGLIQEFGVSQEVAILGLSLFVLGFALGPLIFAPMSELYGRQITYLITFGAFTAFNAGTAGANNIESVIILRFFAGSFGSSPLTNGGGVIADMYAAKQRGLMMAIFAAAPFTGPALGPIVGGFLGQYRGWRWINGMVAIFAGFMWIFAVLFVPETYAPVLLRKRALKLTQMTGKVYLSKSDADRGKVTPGEALKTSLMRPWILLFQEPIVLILSIYMAIIYGTLYMLFGAFPIVYQQERGWSAGIGGLAFLGVLLGMIIALLYVIFVDNKYYQRAVEQAGGYAPPEARLPPTIIGGIALPVGLFWFAWTNYASIHWMVSIAAGVPFGFGMVLVFLGTTNYLIDSYTIFAASVLAASSVIRSTFGAAFPLFTSQMYESLGIHWASTIPAFLALVCAPFPFLFYKYGAPIRMKCKYAAQADAFMKSLRPQAGIEEEEVTSDQEGEAEKEAEKEGADLDSEEERPRFERIKTGRSVRSVRSERGRDEGWNDNPYDIDRVHTRESFRSESRPRSASRARSLRRTVSRT